MTSIAGPIKQRRRLYYVPQKKEEFNNQDVVIKGDFTNPPWMVEHSCVIDQTFGLYYYDIETSDDKEIVFKFLSEGKYWCLSALYDIKPDKKNAHYLNNHVRASPLINDEDMANGMT